jgi:hypothetical protein
MKVKGELIALIGNGLSALVSVGVIVGGLVYFLRKANNRKLDAFDIVRVIVLVGVVAAILFMVTRPEWPREGTP